MCVGYSESLLVVVRMWFFKVGVRWLWWVFGDCGGCTFVVVDVYVGFNGCVFVVVGVCWFWGVC